jgi:hypothetical protein
VGGGATVLVEVIAAPAAPPAPVLAAAAPLPAPLPAPLAYAEEVLGGERTVVVNLSGCPGIAAPHPFFLTPAQFMHLQRFLRRGPPFDTPSMLMVTGTIKSGKTRIVRDIIPRLLSLHYAQAPAASRRRPVIFHHEFTPGVSGTCAAERWLRSLLAFERSLGVASTAPQGFEAMHALPVVAQALARRVHEDGGQLWLLLDELGAPVAASAPGEAAAFVQAFKDTLQATSPYARTVATGSGMVSLLMAFSAAPPNGFTLWGAASHLCVGQEPRPALALAMAQRLHSAYAPAWPPDVREHVTPQRLLDSLAYGEHAGLTSPRPALLAYLASCLSDLTAAGPAETLRLGLEEVLTKLRTESRGDAAVGLERTSLVDRQALRELAVCGLSPTAYPLSSIAAKLCEEWVALPAGEGGAAAAAAAGGQPRPALRRLLPPYASLLRRWVRPDGWLSITSGSGFLVSRAVQSLVTLQDNWQCLGEDLLRSTSASVLLAFAEHGIGVTLPGSPIRPPTTAAELMGVPAVTFLLAALEHAAATAPGRGQSSHSAKAFRRAAAEGAEAQAKFMAHAGVHVLQLLRNYCGHVSFAASDGALRCGITEAAVDYVVHGAALEVVQGMGGLFTIDVHGALLRKGAPAGAAGAAAVVLPVDPAAEPLP